MAEKSHSTVEGMIAAVLKNHGFRRKGRYWKRTASDEVTHVVDLTRSRYAPETYVGFGVWSQGIHPDSGPDDWIHCDLFGRAEHFIWTVTEVMHALNDDQPISDPQRLERINAICAELHEKFYDRLHTVGDVERMGCNPPNKIHLGYKFQLYLESKGLQRSADV